MISCVLLLIHRKTDQSQSLDMEVSNFQQIIVCKSQNMIANKPVSDGAELHSMCK